MPHVARLSQIYCKVGMTIGRIVTSSSFKTCPRYARSAYGNRRLSDILRSMTNWLRYSAQILAILAAVPAVATPTPQPSAPARPGLSQALGINELKLEMAESTYKLRPSLQTLSDVVSALEDIINSKCLSQLPRTLAYKGNPTEPTCIQLMERLLELHPENPVALCLRDGIEAPSCVEAYARQTSVVYDPSLHASIVTEPALRVGLSRPELDKIAQISDSLSNLNQQYQATQEPKEKQRCIDQAAEMYDQALATACRVTAIGLVQSAETVDPSSDEEIKQIRQKLLSLPPLVREDHQGRLLLEYEAKLKDLAPKSIAWYRQQEILRVIKRPELEPAPSASTTNRTRFLLPLCAQLIQQAATATPGFPAPICHRDGWYSPQCIAALKNWQLVIAKKKAATTGTPGAPQKPESIISTF
jgi:hypothetical protein